MNRFFNTARCALAITAMTLCLIAAAQAQQAGAPAGGPPRSARPPMQPPPTVRSLSTFGLVVADLDKAIAFYRDNIGLDLLTRTSTPAVDAAWNSLNDTPGAKTRHALLKVANEPYAIELVEYSGIERQPVQANHNDPGSSFLNFGVLDASAGFAALRRANPVMVGSTKIPATAQPGRMVGVWIRDPDGHLIEFMQGGWDPERKSLWGLRNVYRSHFGVTMENYQQALAFYGDFLGFDITAGFPPMVAAGQYMSAGPMAAGLGVPSGANMTGVHGHCASARCEMFEFKDAPRTAFHPPLQDPGAAFLSMWVSDLDALLAKAKASGYEIVTAGAAPIAVKAREHTWQGGYDTLPPEPVHDSRQIMLRDPAGFPVLLMQRID